MSFLEVHPVLVDDDARLARNNSLHERTAVFQQENELVQQEERQNGHHAVNKRNGHVRHRDTREVGNDKRYDKFKGLHLADLALAHQPHYDHQRQKNDRGADKDDNHMIIMPQRGKNMLTYGGKSCNIVRAE